MFAPTRLQPVRLKAKGSVIPLICLLVVPLLGTQVSAYGQAGSPSEAQDAASVDQRRTFALTSMAEADKLRADWKEQSLHAAVLKYGAATMYWRSIGGQREAAEALEATGDLHFILSEYDQALDSYGKALVSRQMLKDEIGMIKALDRMGYTCAYLGQNQRALAYLQRARTRLNMLRPLAGDVERTRMEAQLVNSYGEVYYSLSDVKKALDSFSHALKLWQTIGDSKGEALASLNMGYMYQNFGDLKGAQERYDRSLSLWLAAGNKRGEALAITAMGGIRFFLGEQQAALELHNQALSVFRMIGDRNGEAATLNGIGTAYEGLNKPQDALDNYQRAMSLYHEIGNLDYEGLGKFYLGAVYRSLGDLERARLHYHQSLSLLRRVGDERLETYVLKDLAITYSSKGQAQRALAQYQRVLRLYGRFEDKRGQANTLSLIGDIYSSAGHPDKALALYLRALVLVQTAQDRGTEIIILSKVARAERAIGNTAEALGRMKESLDLIEGSRVKAGSPDQRASYFASFHEHYEQYQDLLMNTEKHRPGNNYASTAFFTSERSRARSLLEMLVGARVDLRQGADPALIERSDEVERLLDAKAQYQMRLLSAKPDQSDVAEVEKEIRALAADYEDVQARIRKQSSLYLNFTQPAILHLEEVQSELKDNNTLLLEYALGNEHSYLWAITSESFTWHELPNRTTIEKAAGDIYKLLTAREPINGETQSQAEQRALAADAQYGDRSLELSRMLLGPVRDQLGVRRIIIVADGALQYVPFEALPVDFSNGTDSPSLATAPGDRPPLVREHEVLYLQSASMLRVLSRARSVSQSQQNRVLVFADPVFAENDPRVRPSPQDQVKENNAHAATEPQALVGELPGNLPRLPSTLQEAKMILSAAPYGSTKILTGFEANKQATVASDFSQYKILHFATHAIINSEHPELSGIVLSLVDRNGKRQSGFLRLPDVYKLNLDADLIVVSACRSALGQHFSGEGFIGLTRGFMSGGARSVVASLWKVDDEATAELMNQFYRAMFNEGLPPSAALRKAKQAMQVSPQWSHPYFWAAFVLQGEYRERISVDHNGTAQGSAITELLMILALLGLCVRSRQRKRTG